MNKSLDQDLNVYMKEVWNDAIEAAAKICEYSGYAEQIRELKKASPSSISKGLDEAITDELKHGPASIVGSE